jgi:hypothetical protein
MWMAIGFVGCVFYGLWSVCVCVQLSVISCSVVPLCLSFSDTCTLSSSSVNPAVVMCCVVDGQHKMFVFWSFYALDKIDVTFNHSLVLFGPNIPTVNT